jgi:hypothetical protein
MPSHGADGLRMALAPGHALVEATDVAVRVAAAHQTDRVRGFDERPYLKALRRSTPSAPRIEELWSAACSISGIPR